MHKRWLIAGAFLLLNAAATGAPIAALPLDSIVVDIAADETLVLERHENAALKIDGHLDETVWQEQSAYDEFVVLEPDTLLKPCLLYTSDAADE